MVGVKKQLWDMFVSVAEQLKKDDSNIILNYSAENYFDSIFDKLYDEIKQHFMKDSVINLDRHKVAAITIIAFCRTNVLGYGKELVGSKFWGNYKLAISVGLSYMLDRLNHELQGCGCEITVEKYIMPEVFMDRTSYIDVMARNIYLSELEGSFDTKVLDLAEKLFLIEHNTLTAYGISPSILKRS